MNAPRSFRWEWWIFWCVQVPLVVAFSIAMEAVIW